jgi:hypothetical protein
MTTFLLILLSIALAAIGLSLQVWGGVESHYMSNILRYRPWWHTVQIVGIASVALGASLFVGFFTHEGRWSSAAFFGAFFSGLFILLGLILWYRTQQ